MPSLLDLLGETWPARMAKSAWSAAKLPGDVYAGRVDPLSEEGIGRAADLGGMVMGGTFAGAPRGAMGAGPVRRSAAELPMDEASRMARAAEQGLTTPAYHGTTAPEFAAFENRPDFMLDRALGAHFAKDPEISNSFVMDRVNRVERGAKGGARVMPVQIPAEESLLRVQQKEYRPGVLQSDQSAIEQLTAKEGYKKDPAMFERYLTQARAMPEAEAKSVAADLLAGKTRDIDGMKMDMDRFLYNFGGRPHNDADRAKLVDLARQSLTMQGWKGLRYTNTSPMEMATAKDPTSYVVFNPSDVRSRFAKFDPKNIGKSGLMLGGAGALNIGRQKYGDEE